MINAGKSFNARNLAVDLEVSQPAISKALPLLEKEKIILIEKDKASGRFSIALNRDSKKNFEMKRAENLGLIYESGLADFLQENFPGATIILFGSYSRGDDNLDSDIDIAIINNKQKQIDLSKFESILFRKIVLQFYKNFKDIHKNLKDSILNGIILSGSVDL
jgi:predicted nucleotidyltransferase